MEKENKNAKDVESSENTANESSADDSNKKPPKAEQNSAEKKTGESANASNAVEQLNSGRKYNETLSFDNAQIDEYGSDEISPKKKKHGRIIRNSILAVCIVAISVALSYLIISGLNDIFAFSKPTTTAEIEVPGGATAEDITALLYDNGIINHKWSFRIVLSMRDDSHLFQEGIHYLSAKWDYEMIIEELKTIPSENSNTVTLTFQEGINLESIAEMLEKNEVCSASLFLKEINASSENYEFSGYLKKTDASMKYYTAEGYAFPDTYTFYKKEDVSVVADKFLSNFDKKMSDANLYALIAASDFTLDEAIALASIIQAEAGTPADMALISSVLHNRLNNSAEYPRLECDPTKKYSKWMLGNMKDSNNVNENMAAAYDTYTSEGLPPGAICNPGIEAIRAVLNPASTNYYYFCANLETKECFYAISLDEHNDNLVKAGLK